MPSRSAMPKITALFEPFAFISLRFCLPPKIRFIDFNVLAFTAERAAEIGRAHKFAKFVRHTPSRFVSNAKLTLQFFRRHAVASAGHQIHGEEPEREASAGLLEDRPGAREDVVTAFLTGKATALAHGMVLGLLYAAGWARDFGAAVADFHKAVQAGRIVGKLGLKSLECVAHRSTLTCREGIANGLLVVKGYMRRPGC